MTVWYILFVFAAKAFAEDSMHVQKESFQDYGVMADWGGQVYRTMDPQYEVKQLDVFYTMYEKVEPTCTFKICTDTVA